MKSVEYPEGYFYVERTLALLFGLVAQLSPKLGLPGLVMPHAPKLPMRGLTPSPAPAPKSEGWLELEPPAHVGADVAEPRSWRCH